VRQKRWFRLTESKPRTLLVGIRAGYGSVIQQVAKTPPAEQPKDCSQKAAILDLPESHLTGKKLNIFRPL